MTDREKVVCRIRDAIAKMLKEQGAVVLCKDCKHRPTDPENKGLGQSLVFPDDVCPCQIGDNWYSWMPKDNWFCADGKRRQKCLTREETIKMRRIDKLLECLRPVLANITEKRLIKMFTNCGDCDDCPLSDYCDQFFYIKENGEYVLDDNGDRVDLHPDMVCKDVVIKWLDEDVDQEGGKA